MQGRGRGAKGASLCCQKEGFPYSYFAWSMVKRKGIIELLQSREKREIILSVVWWSVLRRKKDNWIVSILCSVQLHSCCCCCKVGKVDILLHIIFSPLRWNSSTFQRISIALLWRHTKFEEESKKRYTPGYENEINYSFRISKSYLT